MTRRIPPLRGLLLALLLACPAVLRAQGAGPQPKTIDAAAESRRLKVPFLRATIASLLAVPSQDVPKGPALEQVGKLNAGLSGLFGADIAIQHAVYQAQPTLIEDVSSVYADARYASRLPALPWWFQRELGLVQIAQAEKRTAREADALRKIGKPTPDQREQLKALEARKAVLINLGTRIARVNSAGDLDTSASSLSTFFEAGGARGQAPAPPSDGVQAASGLKPLPAGMTAAPAPAQVAGTAPPVPGASAAAAAPSGFFLPSLRVAVDAIQRSFPLPFDPRILSQSASVQALRLQTRKAFGAVNGVAIDCSRKPRPTGISVADCSRAQDLAQRYMTDARALNVDEQSGAGPGEYLSRIAELARWKDDAESFLREYLAVYEEAHRAKPGAPATWVSDKLASGDAALGKVPGAQTAVHGTLAAMGVVGNAGSSAFYHASGATSMQLGDYERAAGVVGKEGAALLRSWGMNGAADWAGREADSLESKGTESVAYGVATMIQSKYGLPAEWYMQHPAVDAAVLDDLRTFAVAHQYENWGDALPAASYFGYADMDPDRARIARETREGAGGLDGYVKEALDEGGDAWHRGDHLKGAGLSALGMSVKAGDFASQSLAFAGVGEVAAGLAKTQTFVNLTGTLGKSAVAARASSLLDTVGANPAVAFAIRNSGKAVMASPMVAGGAQSGAALFDAWHELPEGEERTHALAEQSASFVGAFGPLALGLRAKNPQSAGMAATEAELAGPRVAKLPSPALTPGFHEALLSALGDEPTPAMVPASEGAQAPAAIRSLASRSRSEYTLNGKPAEHVGSGGYKDVLVHPDDPGLVVKVFQNTSEPTGSLDNMRFESRQTALLEEAGAAPPTLTQGAVMNGADRAGYLIQERVRGADLKTMTPSKYKAVQELFGRLVEKRISLAGDHDWKAAENIMVGTTESDPNPRAYVVDADGLRQVPPQNLFDRLSGKPDPLRQYYDGLLAQYAREMARARERNAVAPAEPAKPAPVAAGPGPTELPYPGDDRLVVKIEDARTAAAAAVKANETLLARAGVEPPSLESGALKDAEGRPVEYRVQERVQGSDLSEMTPYKLEQVRGLFDKLVKARVRLNDPETSIRSGRTESEPALGIYVTEASTARLEPLSDQQRLAGSDPLRAYYDGLLAEYERRAVSQAAPESGPSGAGTRPPPVAARPAPEAFTAAETAAALEGSLGPEQRAGWTSFKQGILSDLADEGFPPQRAARFLETALASPAGGELLTNARLSPEQTAATLKNAFRARMVKEQVQTAFAQDPKAGVVKYWLSKNTKRLAGLGVDDAMKLVRSDLAELDSFAAKAAAFNKAKDYDGLLKYADELAKTRPDAAPYLTPWKNIALREGYDKATHHWLMDPQRARDYAQAQQAGRVESFYQTNNLECQSGPSCAIHALYNIVDAHLSEVGGATPDYGAFEEAVQRHLLPKTKGERVGWDRGTTKEEIADAAKAMGLKATVIDKPPSDPKTFDDLLRSRDGAAYASIQYREGDLVAGEAKGVNHAVFIGERWTDAQGKAWYSVADSNAGPDQLSFYTWEQLRPRLNFVVLLDPEDPAAFQGRVREFVGSGRGPPGEPGPTDWRRVTREPDYARNELRKYPGAFGSTQEFLDYARLMAQRGGGSGPVGEGASVPAPAGPEKFSSKAPETLARERFQELLRKQAPARDILAKVPPEGFDIHSKTTRKGAQEIQYVFKDRNDAMNWAQKRLGLNIERVYDEKGKWIGWKNPAGDTVYWGHGDWYVGDGMSRYPHINYSSGGEAGHLFLGDKISNSGLWADFVKEFSLRP